LIRLHTYNATMAKGETEKNANYVAGCGK